jgi:hypothetical protein
MSKNVPSIDNIKRFTDQCFDRESEKAAEIIRGILEAQSPRLSDISNNMSGNADANYKSIQRFIDKEDPKEALHRMYDDDSEYVLGDPTDIERLQARKTEYVGKLKSKKPGFWMMSLSTPYSGRAIPFSFITYSSSTINAELSSRNMEHIRCIGELKSVIRGKTLVLDREFSYELMFEEISEAGIHYVIRLKTGNKPNILTESGEKISLTVGIGETEYYRGVYYKGKVKVNVAGIWKRGLSEPLWVISNLDPEEALRIYKLRMKIEESFRDLKGLLNLDKIMNKKRGNMEKMVALVLLAYAIGLLIGEELRNQAYSGSRKWKLFSGLFVLLKRKLDMSRHAMAQAIQKAYLLFRRIVFDYVRTHV